MNNQDYIRKGVELADGWQTTRLGNQRVKVFVPHGDGGEHPLRDIGCLDRQWVLDALAAQLVRQVDTLPVGEFPDDAPTALYSTPHEIQVWHKKRIKTVEVGPDRTMNTINAIVDSGVLDQALKEQT